MTIRHIPQACYRSPDNGVRFIRNGHRPDCTETECRGCMPCPERHHCTASRNCSWHLQPGELTCGRCIGGVRKNLRWIGDLEVLVEVQALADGVDSEAANLAGPAADYATFSARRRIAKRWIEAHLPFRSWEAAQERYLDDDDEHHPGVVLPRWEAMLREDYDQPTEHIDLATALGYLDRQLYRVANDPEQDFGLLKREIKKCRQHLEAVIHNNAQRDKGAPCPTCRAQGHIERLVREYAHWCDDEGCERIHFQDDGSDIWRCPRNADHWWTQQGYADLVAARKEGMRA